MTVTDTVFFDLDGTLLDTLDDLTEGVNHVLSRFSYKERTKQEICSFIGDGVPVLLGRAMSKSADQPIPEQIRLFGEYYQANMTKHTRPYKGINRLLTELCNRGYKIGVVSNKNDSAVKKLCYHFFGDLISFSIGTTTYDTRKPSPFLINKALAALEAEKKSAVLVGDTEIDIKTAENAGIKIICVGWGFRSKEFLKAAGAEIVVDNPDNLLDYFPIQKTI